MSRQTAPREYTCYECAQHLNYMSEIPQRQAGVMMYLGDHFCTHAKKARKLRKRDLRSRAPDWCPRRKTPCALRIYYFRSPEEWALYQALSNSIGIRPHPVANRYAVETESCIELSPRDFWLQLNMEKDFLLLGTEVKPDSVVEIDDGLRPVFFHKTEESYEILWGFRTEVARANIREGFDE